MTTNNSVNTPLAGSTGTNNFVGANSPTFVTPVLGAATATTLAFSATTSGIIGTTAADNASTGKVGEVITSAVLIGAAIIVTSGVTTNLTSITLSAGDWDIYTDVFFNSNTTSSINIAGISTTSATLPDKSLCSQIQTTTAIQQFQCGLTIPVQRFNVSGSTIVYAVGQATFPSGANSICGQILARRIR